MSLLSRYVTSPPVQSRQSIRSLPFGDASFRIGLVVVVIIMSKFKIQSVATRCIAGFKVEMIDRWRAVPVPVPIAE